MADLDRTARPERTALVFTQRELSLLIHRLSDIDLSPREALLLFFILAAAQDNISRLYEQPRDDLKLKVTLEAGIVDAFTPDIIDPGVYDPTINRVITARIGNGRIGT